MNDELIADYVEASRPFIEGGGAITAKEYGMKSWRYFLEINSACNLACPTCTKGNKAGYDHETGVMDPDLMEKCIDKIASENPNAIVFLYGNSEPFIHPRLPECIASVKRRGLRCELSTNLNYVQRLDETLDARPDFMIISLSGFTQDVYVKGHAGGNIDKVKANMLLLGEANSRASQRIQISVNYHVYKDNGGAELESMRAFAAECGIGFFTSTARAISMENAIQYCREHDESAERFAIQENRPDWNNLLPPVSKQWNETMDRLKIPPDKARGMYDKYPVAKVCPVGAGGIFTFIRHDGKLQLCACTADRRITQGNYLDATPDEMIEKRTDHAICQQCMKYRLNLYFMICQRDLWD
jgi:MoaA/NifB/PqqE/SkfB family radical SAM enzyme